MLSRTDVYGGLVDARAHRLLQLASQGWGTQQLNALQKLARHLAPKLLLVPLFVNTRTVIVSNRLANVHIGSVTKLTYNADSWKIRR